MAATKAMLQAKCRKRAKRVEKLWINLSTAYGLVLGQCTDYLRSRLEGQERWEQTPNERDLLELIKSIKSLLHKYDKDTEYHHVAYYTLFCRFMLFRQGNYRNSEYKQRFKDKIEVLEAYNRGSYWGTAREKRQGISQHWDWTPRLKERIKGASVGKGKILGDRLPTQLRQALVQRAHPIA